MWMFVPKGTKVTFVADGEYQEFELVVDSCVDDIETAIFEGYGAYREESLCFNGANYMFPNIKSGYVIVEGKIAEKLLEKKVETWYSLKHVKDVLRLGIRKGDTFHLKGVSSFKISDVDYGDRLLTISVE
jgi:hypothetical protein